MKALLIAVALLVGSTSSANCYYQTYVNGGPLISSGNLPSTTVDQCAIDAGPKGAYDSFFKLGTKINVHAWFNWQPIGIIKPNTDRSYLGSVTTVQ